MSAIQHIRVTIVSPVLVFWLTNSSLRPRLPPRSVFAQHLAAQSTALLYPRACLPGYPCDTGIPEPTGALVKAMLIHSTVVSARGTEGFVWGVTRGVRARKRRIDGLLSCLYLG